MRVAVSPDQRSPPARANRNGACRRWPIHGAALGCLAVIVGAASPALSAVSFDQAVSRADMGPTFLLRPVIGNGADRFLIVAVAFPSSDGTVQSVTAGALPLAHLITSANPAGAGCRLEIWTLPAPPSGENLVTITASGSFTEVVNAAISYAGVNATQPIGRLAQAQGSGTATSLDVESSPDEVVLDALCSFSTATPPIAPGGDQTSRWNRAANDVRMGGSDRAGAPTVTMEWTIGAGSATWASAALSLRASSSPTPVDASVPGDASGDRQDATNPDAPTPSPDGGSSNDTGAASPDRAPVDAVGSSDAVGPDDAPASETPAPTITDAAASSVDISLEVGCACRASVQEPTPGGIRVGLGLWLVFWLRRRSRTRERR